MFCTSSIRRKHENQSMFDCSKALKQYRCVECPNYQTNFLVHLKRHIRDGHHGLEVQSEELHKCVKCNLRTHSRILLLRHNCELSAKDKNDVQSNLTINQLKKKILSKLKRQSTPKSEETHQFKCQYCSVLCKFSWCLKRHQLLCHPKLADKETRYRPFKCKHCPHETKRRTDLQRHITDCHSRPDEIQWFECDRCPSKFKRKYQLKCHLLLHAPPKDTPSAAPSFRCDQCPYGSKRKGDVERHIIFSHAKPEEIPWFECEHCPLKFKRKDRLRNHLVLHAKSEDVVWFRCEQCPYRCRLKTYLKSHVKMRHTKDEDVQWLACEHCPTKFKRRDTLKLHVRRFHARAGGMQ